MLPEASAPQEASSASLGVRFSGRFRPTVSSPAGQHHGVVGQPTADVSYSRLRHVRCPGTPPWMGPTGAAPGGGRANVAIRGARRPRPKARAEPGTGRVGRRRVRSILPGECGLEAAHYNPYPRRVGAQAVASHSGFLESLSSDAQMAGLPFGSGLPLRIQGPSSEGGPPLGRCSEPSPQGRRTELRTRAGPSGAGTAVALRSSWRASRGEGAVVRGRPLLPT